MICTYSLVIYVVIEQEDPKDGKAESKGWQRKREVSGDEEDISGRSHGWARRHKRCQNSAKIKF